MPIPQLLAARVARSRRSGAIITTQVAPRAIAHLVSERPLGDLHPGDATSLRVCGVAGPIALTIEGPSAASFRIESRHGAEADRFRLVADAPGIARVVVAHAGGAVLHQRIACRAPVRDGVARCAAAAAAHQARLVALDGFVLDLVGQVSRARAALEALLRARGVTAPRLTEAREVELLLTDPIAADDPARRLLRAVWMRIAAIGVPTRALVILAPDELARAVASAPPPATLAELVSRIRGAVAREGRWVTALLARWPQRLARLTARAPDLELAAGVGPVTAEVASLPPAYWRAWFLEHGLAIRPTGAGPHATWRTSRALLHDVADVPPGWAAAVAAELDAAVAAVNAMGVL